ncbi:MAG: DUF58 domain-containing protein [Psychroflexus halocasei]
MDLSFNSLEAFDFKVNSIVEGFISGFHKSPFHGFSSEFAEHKFYNKGDSTKHIDWKLFARTEKLYIKKFQDDTNLRCHFILDTSHSMFLNSLNKNSYSKIQFSSLAIASLCQLLMKQRDAFGLSFFDHDLKLFLKEKNSYKHYRLLQHQLSALSIDENLTETTEFYSNFEFIANKINQRSVIVLFSDMLSDNRDEMLEALKLFKFKKAKVILFHVLDHEQELDFKFKHNAVKFKDLETHETLKLYPDTYLPMYQKYMNDYLSEIKNVCLKYKITYVDADINSGFNKILESYFLEN